MSLAQSLENLVSILENKGISIRPHLRPSLSRENVQALLNSFGVVPPEELYALYEWHDGIDVLNTPELLFGEYQFLSLNDAIQEYQEILKHYSQTSPLINLAQCFPFASFQGANCTIYCDSSLVDGLQHPVIEIFHGIAPLFENIDRMALTVAEWFASGIYDSEPVNDTLRTAIRQRLNPHIPYRSVSL